MKILSNKAYETLINERDSLLKDIDLANIRESKLRKEVDDKKSLFESEKRINESLQAKNIEKDNYIFELEQTKRSYFGKIGGLSSSLKRCENKINNLVKEKQELSKQNEEKNKEINRLKKQRLPIQYYKNDGHRKGEKIIA